MLDDAVYYSRRETDEVAAARSCTDLKVRQVHLLLAAKYSELARQALAGLREEDVASVGAGPIQVAARATRSDRRLR
jgi:hypothetical protein